MSQEFLKGFLDRIGNEIEYGVDKLGNDAEYVLNNIVQTPGKALVNTVETGLGLNQRFSPGKYLINPIRNAIGNSQLKNNDAILSERKRDGSFTETGGDALFMISADDKKKRALSQLKTDEQYQQLNNIGFKFTDDKGNLLSNNQINTATTASQLPIFQQAIADGVDLGKIDLTKANKITLTKEVNNKKILDKAAAESVDTTGLSIPQIERKTADAVRKRENVEALENPLTKASLDNTRSLIQQRSDQTGIQRETLRLDNLNRNEDRRLQASQFNQNYALQLKQAQSQAEYNSKQLQAQIEQSRLLNEQANLDRERLNEADIREYAFREKELKQRRFDEIFNIIGSLNLA